MGLIFGVLLLIVTGKILIWSIKAAWGITKILVTIIFFPLMLIAMVYLGLIYLALLILIVVGIIAFVN